MISYANPVHITYSYPALNFVSGAGTFKIKPPQRLGNGWVTDIHVRVTTLFTQTTTPAYVRIGNAADNDQYAELNMGAAAAATAYNTRDLTGVVKGEINLVKDGITDVEMRIVAPTGGSPAGVGDLAVVIGWY